MANEDKWGLMSAVYGIISLQCLLAVAVGSVVISFSEIPHFVLHTAPGLSIYILSIVLWVIIQCMLLDLRKRWPWNCVLFVLWTILFASAVGLSCSYSKGSGKTVLEAIILASAVAVVLTLYSFWSAMIERDFNLCELLLISLFVVLCIYIPIQIFHPFAKLSTSIYACVVAIAFASRMCLAGNFFINYEFYDPLGAAVIVYFIFCLSNPGQKELVEPPANREPLRNP